jgi:lysophospholipase L1-like esterase
VRFFCLSKRDALLLPLVSLLTLTTLFLTAELGSRLLWRTYGANLCMTQDPHLGVKWTPNCTAHVKGLETTPAVYHFNECGFRAAGSCGAKPPGDFRLIAVGSSNVFGYWLDAQDTFPDQLASMLRSRCATPVEVQNLGLPGTGPAVMASRSEEVLNLRPDLVVVGLSASDIFEDSPVEFAQPAVAPPHQSLGGQLLSTAKQWSRESRLIAVARHYLYENRAHYLQAMLLRGDGELMSRHLSPAMEARFQRADAALGRMASTLKAARIPLVLVYLPDRARAMLMKQHDDYPGLEPYSVRDLLRAAAERHGMIFIDPSQTFRDNADPGGLFYPADGHMNPAGHALVAEASLRALLGSPLEARARCEKLDNTTAQADSPR